MCTDIFVALVMLSEGNAKKNEEQRVDFSFTTMLKHTGRFLVKDFLAKRQAK
jgi:hypothetical protein